MKTAAARAHVNIALAKYWGKADVKLNLPAVPSLSATIEGLFTETTVTFSPELVADSLVIDGQAARPGELERASRFLDLVRADAGSELQAAVVSQNSFPRSAGLASSASAFAALVLAAFEALGAQRSTSHLSALARLGSGSAARSVFGGYVEMETGDTTETAAKELVGADWMPLSVVVAVVSGAEKSVSSTEGMLSCQRTSPFYPSWLETAQTSFLEIREALVARAFDRLARATEQNCLAMHALALTAVPPMVYWKPTTLKVIEVIRALQSRGTPVFFTIDAGPNVIAFCDPSVGARVLAAFHDLGVEARLTRVGGTPQVSRS